MPEPLLQSSSSPLQPLRMSRCKIQTQRLRAEAKIFCAHSAGCHSLSRIDGPIVFEPESSINNHVTYNCAARVSHDSRSILPLPPLTVLRPIIHLQNRSKLTDKQMDKDRRIVHPKLQLLIQKTNYLKKTYYLYDANYPRASMG